MQAGGLRHRVKLQQKQSLQDENGLIHETYINIGEFWAKINDLSLREFLSSASLESKITTKIIVRYNEIFFQKNLRILHCGIYYYIEGALNDPEKENIYLTLLCNSGTNKER